MFEADLTAPGSFDAAVKGADYVFHVASPMTFEVSPANRKDAQLPASDKAPQCQQLSRRLSLSRQMKGQRVISRRSCFQPLYWRIWCCSSRPRDFLSHAIDWSVAAHFKFLRHRGTL